MHVAGTVSKPANVNVNGFYAPVDGNLNFAADVPVTSGSNTIAVNATGTNGQVQTNRYGVNVVPGSSRTPLYDAVGNMIDNGSTQTYQWDAENRLVAINYVGTQNSTQFTYNGLGQRIQIVEETNGTPTSTKQFLWVPGAAQPSEEWDASNNVTKRFYGQGEQIGGSNYYFTFDHLGSIREMADSSGAVQARYDYRLYGQRVKLGGAMDADFGYTGFYVHAPSGLDLTLYRAYSPDLGRWISRDPIGEEGGINLYGYVENDPISGIDPLGLDRWLVDNYHTYIVIANPRSSTGYSRIQFGPWVDVEGVRNYATWAAGGPLPSGMDVAGIALTWASFMSNVATVGLYGPGQVTVNDIDGPPTSGWYRKITSDADADLMLLDTATYLANDINHVIPYSIYWNNCRTFTDGMIRVGIAGRLPRWSPLGAVDGGSF